MCELFALTLTVLIIFKLSFSQSSKQQLSFKAPFAFFISNFLKMIVLSELFSADKALC